jgi:flagellar protein FlbD
MIYVTRLNRTSIVLNSQLIEHIETTPDTVITLTTGEKLRVLESAEEVVSRIVEYQARIRCVEALTARAERHGGD